ncbi:hypothetical protein jhhlp_002072 [Lomentospora prolificans]|uniref:2EXR domain-containing protein n=1 Tax=Lomentospora prolificans TaxID=41688 RepID=A0A2N3ND20_9PEZI|nr:hypothetical protein jhhlp_002072 [Lomentospora prolificans]
MAQSANFFHHFLELPTELRLTIWNLNLYQPRIVPIHIDAPSPSETEGLSFPSLSVLPQCVSPCPAPANLHVCREARREALKHHRLSFGMYQEPGRVFFNPDSDILYFGYREGFGASESQFRTAMSLCSPADLAQVRRLAINEAVFRVGCKYVHSLAADVLALVRLRMPALEELVFVPATAAGTDDTAYSSYDADLVLAHIGTTNETIEMTRQVKMALDDFCTKYPDWKKPNYRVMAIVKASKQKKRQ